MARPFLLLNTPKMLIVALFAAPGIVGAPLPAHAQDAGQPDNQQYRCLPGTSRCASYQCDPTCRRASAWENRDFSRGVDGDAPPDASTGGYDRRYDAPANPGYDPRYTPPPAANGYDQSYQAQNGYQASPGGYGPGGYDQRGGDDQVGAAAPTAPGAGYGGGGYGGGGYAGNNYANAYGYSQDYGQGYRQQGYGQQNGYGDTRSQPPVNPPADAQGDDEDQGQDYADNRPPQPSYRYSGQAQYRCVDDGYRCAYFRCDPQGDDCHRISAWSSRADADRRPDDDGW